jgi:hypothetical protein
MPVADRHQRSESLWRYLPWLAVATVALALWTLAGPVAFDPPATVATPTDVRNGVVNVPHEGDPGDLHEEKGEAGEGGEDVAEPIFSEAKPGRAQALPTRALVPRPSLAPRPKGNLTCVKGLADWEMTPFEEELRRLYKMALDVMKELGTTGWPVDASLLGMMRNGRIATDRDVDMAIQSTYGGCKRLLTRLRKRFKRRAKMKGFKVALTWHPTKGKIGRYALVRVYREFGTFDTGIDFNCVYMDDPENPTFHLHNGQLVSVPHGVFPLGSCLFYGEAVPCPGDGYAILEALKPRYEGCMVFPHCMGDPMVSVPACRSPHPVQPLVNFVADTQRLTQCGFTSLADHYESEPSCKNILQQNALDCQVLDNHRLCFVQPFDHQ